MKSKTEEYPKNINVPFIPADSIDDAVIACYSLIKTDVSRPEITMLSKKPKSIIDNIKYSINPVLITLTANSEESCEKFLELYRKNRAGISAVVALDKKDKLRVSISLPPEDAAEKAGVPVKLMLMVYDRETEAELDSFFSKWNESYLTLVTSLINT